MGPLVSPLVGLAALDWTRTPLAAFGGEVVQGVFFDALRLVWSSSSAESRRARHGIVWLISVCVGHIGPPND